LYWLNNRVYIKGEGKFINEKYLKREQEVYPQGVEELKTNKLLLKTALVSNFINYDNIYLNGFYNYFSFENIRSKKSYERFIKISNEFKLYKKINLQGNFAFRLRTGISSNQNSPFASFVADTYLNIRGVGDRIARGTAELATNLEYRHYINSYRSLKLTGVGFVDAGTWRNPAGKIKELIEYDSAVFYSGIGVRVHLSKFYNSIFRLDYSVNLRDINNRVLIFGVGQYF